MSTCIIICKTNEGIIVVADTRSANYSIDKKYDFKSTSTINKVGNVGNYYVAIAGHDNADLMSTALNVLNEKKTLLEVAQRFAIDMQKVYFKVLTLERQIDVERFNFYKHNALASVCFFSNFDNQQQLIAVDLNMKINKNGSLTITHNIAMDRPIYFLGFHDHIDKLPDAELIRIRDIEPKIWMKQLVKLEMSKHSEFVGCPIQTFTLKSNQKAIIETDNCH